METKENQYLSLKVDLGALGDVYLMVLDNTKKEKPTDPDVRVLIQKEGSLKRCGAGWINTKKQPQVSNAVVEEHI